MASLLSGNRKSLLDSPIGVDESRARQASDRSVKNEVQEMKRTERLGRRAYRAALRGRDPSAYIKGLQALEMTRDINGTSGAGIKMSGVTRQGIEDRLDSTRSQLDSFNGKTVDENGRIAKQPQSRILGNPDGDGNGVPDMIQRLDQPDTVNPNATAGAGYGTPIKQDAPRATSLTSRLSPATGDLVNQNSQPPVNPEANSAFGDKTFRIPWDTKSRFASDLSSSKLIQEGDGGALQRALARGSKLGISESSIISFLNRGLEKQEGAFSPASRLLSR